MKIRAKQILPLYFNSWWVPAAVCLLLLVAFSGAALPPWQPLATLVNVLFVCLAGAFLGILSASVWNFIRKRWAKAIVNLLMLPMCGVAALFALTFLMVASMFGPSEDHFADELKIPEGIAISEPRDESHAEPGGPEDTFQPGFPRWVPLGGIRPA